MDSNTTIECIHAHVEQRRREAATDSRRESKRQGAATMPYDPVAVNRTFAKLGLLAYR